MSSSSSQIFKEHVPSELLYELFRNISVMRINNVYVVDYNAYKKGMFNNSIPQFMETCKEYYHVSKQKKYLQRTITYNSFITVVRQICNCNNIGYSSVVKHDKSSYSIIYYVSP